ncbi:MAG: SDR family oxidoreductase [Bryobacteraceae bacterium]
MNAAALILGSSSGFGAAAAVEFARAGYDIYGVHFDRRETLPQAERVRAEIRGLGRRAAFFNLNAIEDDRRREVVEHLKKDEARVRVLLHSLAFGTLKPIVGASAVNRKQLETTVDAMGHSLIYWVQDLLEAGLLAHGSRIYAMTSEGSGKAVPEYGPVSAAKAVLEAHIRQLALELAPLGITANAILAGVTDTPALRRIPGHEKLMAFAMKRNPHGRLTTPLDVARCLVTLSHDNTYWMTGNTIRVDGGEGAVA